MLGMGAIGAAATLLYGYYQGYQVCKATYQAAIMRAEIKRLNLAQMYLKSSIQAAQDEVDKSLKEDQLNKAVINDLQTLIRNARDATKAKGTPSNRCELSDSFLRRLDTIH